MLLPRPPLFRGQKLLLPRGRAEGLAAPKLVPLERVLGTAPPEFGSPEPAPRGASASSATGRRGHLSPRPAFRCCPQEAAGDAHTCTRAGRSRAPSGRKVAGAPTAADPGPRLERCGRGGRGGAARDSARCGRARKRRRRCRWSPSPPRLGGESRAGPGRWTPPVAKRSPAPPHGPGRRPPRLPR